MPAVMTELAEKKVRTMFRHHGGRFIWLLSQIEGFKLHLNHTLKPFTNRIRYAPEVASRPDRLAKDLASAKTLALWLEDEYDRIRRPPPREDAPSQNDSSDPAAQSGSMEDTLMTGSTPDQDPDEDAPKSRGSEAVERHIEKVISELQESDVVNVMSERGFEAMKVSFIHFRLSRAFHPPPLPHTPLGSNGHRLVR